MTTPDPQHGQTAAFAEFAFGSHTQVIDASRPLAWLSPEEMHIDLDDPIQRRFGDYELLEKIGQGGMGVVYRARQHGLERDVAIKLLAAGPWASEEFVARFRREARSAARMQHPNIVEIYEFGHRDGLNYFSMRLIEGRSLAQRLNAEGPLPALDAAKLLRTLAEAMDYAHRLGVLHLDLKPANVLLTPNGTPLIADFGLARRIDAGHDGGADEISGTPSYMAPEQATLQMHPLTAATDIYGLGAILYEVLTGQPPFRGADPQATLERVVAEAPANPRSLRKDIPQDLEAICLKCLEKNPAQRYASARDFAEDLGNFIAERNVSVRTPGMVERLRRWVRREPKLARMFAIDFAAALLGGALLAYLYVGAEHARKEAVAQRDSAQIASELGAYLFAHSENKAGEDRARGLIDWLRKRLPGDETRQADALTAFVTSVSRKQGVESPELSELLMATVRNLGTDYRHRVIQALQKSSLPYRDVYSAMLTYVEPQTPQTRDRFHSFLQSAIAARPDDPFVWQVAAVYCPKAGGQNQCLFPQAAEQLVRIDPGNMIHWLLLASATSDPARRIAALHEAAQRTRVDDYFLGNFGGYYDAIHAAAVPVPPLLARPIALMSRGQPAEDALAALEASEFPLMTWTPVIHTCLPQDLDTLDPQLRADCITIGTRLARSQGGLLTRMIGVALVRPLARGTPLAEEVKNYRREYRYTEYATGKIPDSRLLEYPQARMMKDFRTVGELAAVQRRLAYFGVPPKPPANWQPEDPNSLLSSRERLDNTIAMNEKAAASLASGRYAEAADVLIHAEAASRRYFQNEDSWRLARFLTYLGLARTGLGQYPDAEKNLLEAWNILQPSGPSSGDARDGLKAIVDLYTDWNRAEPGKGHDAKATEWKRKLEDFEASAAPQMQH